jgi:hypothetical protein
VAKGKPDDHPLTDVLVWGSDRPFYAEYPGYTARIVALIKEIDSLGGSDAFADVEELIWETKFRPYRQPELYEALVDLRDRLAQNG